MILWMMQLWYSSCWSLAWNVRKTVWLVCLVFEGQSLKPFWLSTFQSCWIELQEAKAFVFSMASKHVSIQEWFFAGVNCWYCHVHLRLTIHDCLGQATSGKWDGEFMSIRKMADQTKEVTKQVGPYLWNYILSYCKSSVRQQGRLQLQCMQTTERGHRKLTWKPNDRVGCSSCHASGHSNRSPEEHMIFQPPQIRGSIAGQRWDQSR